MSMILSTSTPSVTTFCKNSSESYRPSPGPQIVSAILTHKQLSSIFWDLRSRGSKESMTDISSRGKIKVYWSSTGLLFLTQMERGTAESIPI